jgi:hypothetical protein
MSKSLAEELAMMAHAVGTASSTPLVTSYVSAKNFGRALLIARLGDMASETVDVAIYQGQGGSTNAKSLKAATQLAAHASNNDNGILLIGVDLNDLDVANGFTHIAGRIVTGGVTGGTCTLVLLGGDCRFGPASLVDGTVLGLTP